MLYRFQPHKLSREVLVEMKIPKKGSAYEDPELDNMFEAYQFPRYMKFIGILNLISLEIKCYWNMKNFGIKVELKRQKTLV